MSIPTRTTIDDWAELLDLDTVPPQYQYTLDPLAATSHELDQLWHLHGERPGPRPAAPPFLTVFGRHVVEITDWPDWLSNNTHPYPPGRTP